MTKILHLSDNHGFLDTALLNEGEYIIHTGDLLPNRSRGLREIEKAYQTMWLEVNAQRLKRWIGGRPFLFTPGNHDFVDPCPIMRSVGIDAWNLFTEGRYRIFDAGFDGSGVDVLGFPWVPVFTREWNYECESPEMWGCIAPLLKQLDTPGRYIVAAHAPIYGVLDRVGEERTGNVHMRQVLQDCKYPPELYLHGHIHCSTGFLPWSRGIRISNAATTQRVVTL